MLCFHLYDRPCLPPCSFPLSSLLLFILIGIRYCISTPILLFILLIIPSSLRFLSLLFLLLFLRPLCFYPLFLFQMLVYPMLRHELIIQVISFSTAMLHNRDPVLQILDWKPIQILPPLILTRFLI